MVAGLLLSLCLPACKVLERPKRDPKEMPGARTGFLTAKVAAYRHAMENMPPENKRYGNEYYIVSGIQDADPAHVKVLVAALADMHPKVVETDRIYTSAGNSKWMDGKPAIVWSSRVMRVTDDLHAFIIVGWAHSDTLYEFYEYETRYLKKQDAWEVVDYKTVADLN